MQANPPVLIIRHEPHEGLGLIEEGLTSQGFKLEFLDAWHSEVPEEPTFYTAIVVMGGSMGVYEQDHYPFLTREIQLIKKASCSGVPVLGICLGSQLVAAAAGARVYPGGKKEIGWYPVRICESAPRDALFGVCPQEFVTFHWHGDTFDLPPGAERLASSTTYPNQAFRAGGNVWGIQFHPEITEGMIREWVQHGVKKGELVPAEGDKILSSMPSYLNDSEALGRSLFDRFSQLLAQRG